MRGDVPGPMMRRSTLDDQRNLAQDVDQVVRGDLPRGGFEAGARIDRL